MEKRVKILKQLLRQNNKAFEGKGNPTYQWDIEYYSDRYLSPRVYHMIKGDIMRIRYTYPKYFNNIVEEVQRC